VNTRMLTNDEWLDARQVQPPVRNFRHSFLQHRHTITQQHFLRAISTAHRVPLRVPREYIMDFLVHTATPQFILEAVAKRMEHFRSVRDALSPEVSSEPF